MSNRLLILLVLGGIAIFAVGFFLIPQKKGTNIVQKAIQALPTPKVEKTFTSNLHGLSFTYWNGAVVNTEYPSYMTIDKDIAMYVSSESAQAICGTPCPGIKKVEKTTINGKDAEKIEGTALTGTRGSLIEQAYTSYEFQHKDKYYLFRLYEIETAAKEKGSATGTIPQEKIDRFEKFIQSLTFSPT